MKSLRGNGKENWIFHAKQTSRSRSHSDIVLYDLSQRYVDIQPYLSTCICKFWVHIARRINIQVSTLALVLPSTIPAPRANHHQVPNWQRWQSSQSSPFLYTGPLTSLPGPVPHRPPCLITSFSAASFSRSLVHSPQSRPPRVKCVIWSLWERAQSRSISHRKSSLIIFKSRQSIVTKLFCVFPPPGSKLKNSPPSQQNLSFLSVREIPAFSKRFWVSYPWEKGGLKNELFPCIKAEHEFMSRRRSRQ